MSNWAEIKREGYNIPLIRVEKYGTLTKCSDCQDEFGILNYHDGSNVIYLTLDGFICKNCLNKREKEKEKIYE